MAPLSPSARNMSSDDELDAILNGIVQGRDIPDSSNTPVQANLNSNTKPTSAGGLGIDEEIVITKKRAPVPKLDDHRLLSDPGIPRLRKISKERLRFKGKGHEYSDIARMLNMYQLWLDDLYPRAKFADALAIIEKVGHTKRMQMMRKDWIDEGKPRRSRQDDEEDLPEDVPTEANTEEGANAMEGLEGHLNNEEAEHVPEREEHMRDQPNQISKPTTGDNPDDDELDALLAESLQPEIPTSKTLPVRTAADADPFADEMEAMADMDDMW